MYRPTSRTEVREARVQISTPEDAIALTGEALRAQRREQMWVLCLDTKNRAIGEPVMLYQGTVDSCSVRIAELFRDAIVREATSILLLHNHPSGETTPSPEDVRMTREAAAAGDLLDVRLLDHVIVGRYGHTSLRRSGLGFPS